MVRMFVLLFLLASLRSSAEGPGLMRKEDDDSVPLAKEVPRPVATPSCQAIKDKYDQDKDKSVGFMCSEIMGFGESPTTPPCCKDKGNEHCCKDRKKCTFAELLEAVNVGCDINDLSKPPDSKHVVNPTLVVKASSKAGFLEQKATPLEEAVSLSEASADPIVKTPSCSEVKKKYDNDKDKSQAFMCKEIMEFGHSPTTPECCKEGHKNCCANTAACTLEELFEAINVGCESDDPNNNDAVDSAHKIAESYKAILTKESTHAISLLERTDPVVKTPACSEIKKRYDGDKDKSEAFMCKEIMGFGKSPTTPECCKSDAKDSCCKDKANCTLEELFEAVNVGCRSDDPGNDKVVDGDHVIDKSIKA